jgi:lipopolysaccharide export system protein LptA
MPTTRPGARRRRPRTAGAMFRPLIGIGLVLCCWAGLPRPVAAQGLNPLAGSADSLPIDISAESGIEWQQDKQIYVARGHAVAVRGTSEVHADTLTAHYRPTKAKGAEGGNEVYRLDADGHVLIKAPNRTVVGDQAVYDVDQQIGVITGRHLQLTTPTDVVTARDSLEWYDQQQIAVARGDAIAVRGDRRIRADVLTAHFIKDKNAPPAASGAAKAAGGKPAPPAAGSHTGAPAAPASARTARAGGRGAADAGHRSLAADEGSSKISRVDAQGHVVVVTTTDTARADYGVYNAETGIVTLLGNVTITRGQDAIRGEYAVVDLNTNISRMMTIAAKPGAPPPRVEGLFYRQDVNSGTTSSTKPGTRPVSGAPKS